MAFGKELIQSAKEAMAIAEDQVKPPAIFEPETTDVATIQTSQKLSQAELANRYDLSAGTIKD